jgi:serine/threonine protein phosphatase PrpC
MNARVSAEPRIATSPFAIGDPGRAALELPSGPPCARIGHADVESSAAALTGLHITAATIRGLQHRAMGQPRQDAYAIGRGTGDESGHVIAVVCDGVGSLGRSDEAAGLTCRGLVRLRAEGLPWPEAFAKVNDELCTRVEEALSAADSDPVVDGMATTAVAVAVRREASDWVGEVAWVGDSALWCLGPDEQWTLATNPAGQDEADVHSTEVTALPSPAGNCTVREFHLPAGALFLMSDGVSNPLKWSGEVQEELASWWRQPPDQYTFAAQVAFSRKSHMDDRTAVGIWPAQQGRDIAAEGQ